MKKPSLIDLTAGLMILFVVIDIVAAYTVTFTNVHTNPMVTTVMSIPSAICVYFYWKGYEWSRWAVMIASVLVLLLLIPIVFIWIFPHQDTRDSSGESAFAIHVAKSILAIYLLWYLNTAPVKAWFKAPKTSAPAA